MPLRCIIASPSSTVRKMVGVSLANLPCELVMVNSGARLLQQMSISKSDLVIISETLAGTETAAMIEQIIDDSSSKGITTIVLRNRMSTFTVEVFGNAAALVYVDLPFLSQALVQAVCQLNAMDVPDERLYAPYMVQIPLATPKDVNVLTAKVDKSLPNSPMGQMLLPSSRI